MPKYINVDEIDYKVICYPHLDLYTRTVSTEELDGVYALKTDIDAMPPADVQEVKHGKWVLMTKTNAHCSNCNFIRSVETQIGWKYCPMCGALMLEDE